MRLVFFFVAAAVAAPVWSPAASGLLARYTAEGATLAPSAERGRVAWVLEHPASQGGTRSCATCHTADPRRPGRHATTGEVLAPLSPLVTAERLTDAAEIEKWFGRNCTWTLGRTCTAQEKADFLAYINQ